MPSPSQQLGSVLKKPGQMVILPTTVRRENVKFTILSGQSGHVRVKVRIAREPFKSPGLTTVTVHVGGKRVTESSHAMVGTTLTVDAFVGQTISVTTTQTSGKGHIKPSQPEPPEEKPEPGPHVRPGWPSMGIDLGKTWGHGEASNEIDVEVTPAKVRVVSSNGVIQLK